MAFSLNPQQQELLTEVPSGETPIRLSSITIHKNDLNLQRQKYCGLATKPAASVNYWFHATDHESAKNIATQGIDLDRGLAGKDFSDKDGFYLTRNALPQMNRINSYFYLHRGCKIGSTAFS